MEIRNLFAVQKAETNCQIRRVRNNKAMAIQKRQFSAASETSTISSADSSAPALA